MLYFGTMRSIYLILFYSLCLVGTIHLWQVTFILLHEKLVFSSLSSNANCNARTFSLWNFGTLEFWNFGELWNNFSIIVCWQICVKFKGLATQLQLLFWAVLTGPIFHVKNLFDRHDHFDQRSARSYIVV